MARPLRLLIADGIYHVTDRGTERRPIFGDDLDRRRFLRILTDTVRRFDWRCLSYCLMHNHFHLLLRTPQPNLPRGMQQLNSRYAQEFNRRYERVGSLYQGRYGATLLERDEHLLEVFRYIALNPVRAGRCDRPADWPWSSYAAIAGTADAPEFLAVEDARGWFCQRDGNDGAGAYVRFVDESAGYEPADGVVSGSERFVREVLDGVERDPEIPRRHWSAGRPSLDEIFASSERDGAMVAAYRIYGYTMTSIAAHLGCHAATVSRHIKVREEMLDCKI